MGFFKKSIVKKNTQNNTKAPKLLIINSLPKNNKLKIGQGSMPSKLEKWSANSDDVFTIVNRVFKKPIFRKYFTAGIVVLMIIGVIVSVSSIYIIRHLEKQKAYNLPQNSLPLDIHFVNNSNSFVHINFIDNKSHYQHELDLTSTTYTYDKKGVASKGFINFNFNNYIGTSDSPQNINYDLNKIAHLQKKPPINTQFVIEFDQQNTVYQTVQKSKPGLIITFREVTKNSKNSLLLTATAKSTTNWVFTDYYHLLFREKADRVLLNSKVMDNYPLAPKSTDQHIFSDNNTTYNVTKVAFNFLKLNPLSHQVNYTDKSLKNHTISISDNPSLVISQDAINNSNANFTSFVEEECETPYNLGENTLIIGFDTSKAYAINMRIEITQNSLNKCGQYHDNNAKYYLNYSFNLDSIMLKPFDKGFDTYFFYIQAYGEKSTWFHRIKFGVDLSLIERKQTDQYKILHADYEHKIIPTS